MSADVHGSLDWLELRRAGVDAAQVVDFSVNVNPFGPSPKVREAILAVDISAYPDRRALLLCEALAVHNGVGFENILTGNGTAELVWLVAQAFLRPGKRALIFGPTFGEYRRAAAAMGATVYEQNATPPDFEISLPVWMESIYQIQPDVVFLCNPNNPTGVCLPERQIRMLQGACPAHTLFVLDEAYRAFYHGELFAPPLEGNGVVLRSMTKDFALAGLRLGYAIAEESTLQALRRFQPPWSVNAVAQAAALAAVDDLNYYEDSLRKLRSVTHDFKNALMGKGAQVIPGEMHYFLIRMTHTSVPHFRKELLQRGINVRDCASFGLPQYIRLGTRLPAENQKLVDVWHLLESG
ncbi:MAG: histidinol-phosphate aminotransferase family protein [Anaerolineae bacterium]|nr:histidinol-phosphate aminotransferase family protein [Anaerolineae bacterium]